MEGYELISRFDDRVSGMAGWMPDIEFHSAWETLSDAVRRRTLRAQAALKMWQNQPSHAMSKKERRKLQNRERKIVYPDFVWYRRRSPEEMRTDTPFLGTDRNPDAGRLAGVKL